MLSAWRVGQSPPVHARVSSGLAYPGCPQALAVGAATTICYFLLAVEGLSTRKRSGASWRGAAWRDDRMSLRRESAAKKIALLQPQSGRSLRGCCSRSISLALHSRPSSRDLGKTTSISTTCFTGEKRGNGKLTSHQHIGVDTERTL